jgi:hypothetical protein
MYLIGADHPNKRDTVSILERLIRNEKRLVTDAEVFQEILHRYRAINRLDAVQPAFDALFSVVDEVFSVNPEDIVRAKDILLANPVISARDAVHAAVMKNRGIEEIFSFDTGFDVFSFIQRVGV